MNSPEHARISIRVIVFVGLGWLLTGSYASAADWSLVVREGIYSDREFPILTRVPVEMETGRYQFIVPGQRDPVAADVFEEQGRWLAALVDRGLSSGRYTLKHVPGIPSREGRVTFTAAGHNLRIDVLGKPFTEYRTDVGAKPFLFPLIGPSGSSYTRAYPMKDIAGEDRDHPHQRSFWFTHGSVNGVDFWSEQAKHGQIRETSQRVQSLGDLLGRLRTTDDWVGPDGRRVCTDERVLTVYGTSAVRVVDFEITLRATDGAVTFGDTKEGMFGLRVASSMDVNRKQGGKIVNAEGLLDDKAWGKPSRWVDYIGPVEGKTVGIAILNHPQSFRYPSTWHVRTYGLFAANPFGWHDFGLGKSGGYTLPAGQSLWFGYRVILHEGSKLPQAIEEQFRAYGEPPVIERSPG